MYVAESSFPTITFFLLCLFLSPLLICSFSCFPLPTFQFSLSPSLYHLFITNFACVHFSTRGKVIELVVHVYIFFLQMNCKGCESRWVRCREVHVRPLAHRAAVQRRIFQIHCLQTKHQSKSRRKIHQLLPRRMLIV